MRTAYQHPGQLAYQQVNANSSVMICSRRWGKSYTVAFRIIDNVREMPGSLGVFVASSFRQAHSRTLPAALMAMEDLIGWKRDVHYVIGKRPDRRLGFKEPLFCPSDLKDVVWFANGTLMVIVSQEVVLSANSLTIHWLVGDEAKGLDYDRLADEVLPALGGSNRYFNDPTKYPHLWGTHFFTDMPTAKEGLWLIKKFEQYRDEELYRLLAALQQRVDLLESQETCDLRTLREIKREANLLRSKAVYYQERSIFDNIAVVGLDYVKRCERNLSPLVYRTSILCKRIEKVEGMFYDAFDKKLHTYRATDNNRLSADYSHQSYDCLMDTDLIPDRPVAISFDYGALINWLVVAQVQGNVHKTLKSFFAKKNRRLREVIAVFCAYYEAYPCKTAYYYYDSTAVATGYVEMGHSAYNIVHDELEKHSWRVKDKYLGNPMGHDRKHRIINAAFSGQETLFPMLNADNNEELIQAMQLAEVTIGSKGVRKDKSGEKTIESDTNLPLELRTDATDAWDTNFLGCLTMPYDDDGFIYG